MRYDMKRRIFFLLLTAFVCLPLAAQKGLRIADFFDGRFRQHKDATEVLLEGRRLSQYDLTLFRSLTLPGAAPEAVAIEQAVRADVAHAVDKEAGMKGGRLYYGFYRLKPLKKGSNRYIFYRNDALVSGGKPTLTLIYMEGAASLDQLRRTFSK